MTQENISIIVAIAQNFAIGKNNDLLFHLPNDLKHFKEITSGHTIIMGRNTLLSLPKWPLVITSYSIHYTKLYDPSRNSWPISFESLFISAFTWSALA